MEEEKPEKEKKISKTPPRRRKSKKERESPITKALSLAVETGEVSFGYNESLKAIKEGKPKLVIISNNIPDIHLNELKHFSTISKVPLYVFEGSAKELASVCGKPFLVSALSIYNEGASNILTLVSK